MIYFILSRYTVCYYSVPHTILLDKGMAAELFVGPALTLLSVALLIIVAWKLGKGLVLLLINSVVGMIILILLNYLPFVKITINIWSILIVAIGGIPGIALVVLLSHFGIAF